MSDIGLHPGIAAGTNAPPSVLVGLIGRGIARSQSPRMHEREGLRLGLNYIYRRLDFDAMGIGDDALETTLVQCEAFGFSGVNVTHPFKQKILGHLHALSPEAKAIGAVNTVVFSNGQRIGHNTDCWGFAQSFRDGLPDVAKQGVLLAGAGGAGKAVCQALVELGVGTIWIYDRDGAAAADTARSIGRRNRGVTVTVAEHPQEVLAKADGLVNATPLGMDNYPGTAVPMAWITPRHWVADIVYFPEETELVTRARDKGCKVLTGGGMAVYQAVKAFELFSGVTPSAPEMAAARTAF